MSSQQRLSTLEALLRAKKERPCLCPHNSSEPCIGGICTATCTGTITDPKMQAAWLKVSRAISIASVVKKELGWDMPEEMGRGLLEQVMETICDIENFRWTGSLEMLFEVITEEIEARSKLEALNER